MLTQSLHLHTTGNTASLFTQIFVKARYEISTLSKIIIYFHHYIPRQIAHSCPNRISYRDWMNEKLNNHQPSQDEILIFHHLLDMQSHCNADLYPKVLAACLA